MIEHHDYEAIPPEVWRCFVAWYGVQDDRSPMMRILKWDRRLLKFSVDLYQETGVDDSRCELSSIDCGGLDSGNSSVVIDDNLIKL